MAFVYFLGSLWVLGPRTNAWGTLSLPLLCQVVQEKKNVLVCFICIKSQNEENYTACLLDSGWEFQLGRLNNNFKLWRAAGKNQSGAGSFAVPLLWGPGGQPGWANHSCLASPAHAICGFGTSLLLCLLCSSSSFKTSLPWHRVSEVQLSPSSCARVIFFTSSSISKYQLNVP